MSKILRRPMFRGGGPVSSYGNGITAPLVPGYQMGGNVRGGIVDLPGGYDLTANERLSDLIKNDFGNASVGMGGIDQSSIGANIVKNAEKKTNTIAGVVDNKDSNTIQANYIPEDFEDFQQYNQFQREKNKILSDDEIDKMVEDGRTKNKKWWDLSNVWRHDLTNYGDELLYEKSDAGKEEYRNELIEENEKKKKSFEKYNIPYKGDVSGNLIPPELRGKKIDKEAIEIEELGLSQLEKDLKNQTESPEISAKDAIAENQELFKELLGSKKARGQDISDMLLRFSGSQGNTLGEKFQNYTRAESAAGPGRGEKINQTAAALAINDYVAGKRAQEQGDLLTKKIDYELDAKNKYLTPQEGDTNAEILRKISTAYKIEPGSNKAIKQLLKFRNPGKKIYGITKDPSKVKAKDLEIGLNIVTHKGAKTIIEKISETETKIIPFSGI